MISKKERLPGPIFVQLYKTLFPKKGEYETASFLYIPSKKTKIACVISKKIQKKAHDRNRIKRCIYKVLKSELQGHTGIYICFPKKIWQVQEKILSTQDLFIQDSRNFIQDSRNKNLKKELYEKSHTL